MGLFGFGKSPEALYQKGRAAHLERDYVKALELYEQAAQKGLAKAQYSCGRMYSIGKGTKVDKAKARMWLEKAAENQETESEAKELLAKLDAEEQSEQALQDGRAAYAARDFAVAFPLLLKAAEQGYADAQCLCGSMYSAGLGTEKDAVKAFMWFEQAAKQGDASAQFHYGYRIFYGMGTTEDKAKALEWFLKAAEQDDANAQIYCASMYAAGEGTAVDKAKARMWSEKAAKHAYTEQAAKELLAKLDAEKTADELFEDGMTAYQAEDYAKALELLEKAAEQGHTQAQFSCGAMYYIGTGAETDYGKALQWYEKAIQQGHADAQFYAGIMYERGEGTQADHAKAIELFEKAAEQGHAQAKSVLASLAEAEKNAPAENAAERPAPASKAPRAAVTQFAYEDSGSFYFLDAETYEMFSCSGNVIPKALLPLEESRNYILKFEGGQVVTVEDPDAPKALGKWNLFPFGNYYQTEDGKKEPVSWRILAVRNDRVLVISDKVLDARPFSSIDPDFDGEYQQRNGKLDLDAWVKDHPSRRNAIVKKYKTPQTWDISDIRPWLNGVFFRELFTSEEQRLVLNTELESVENPLDRSQRTKRTKDKLFLLSLEEIGLYFAKEGAALEFKTSGSSRSYYLSGSHYYYSAPTQYAVKQGAHQSTITKNATYWLRTPGKSPFQALFVESYKRVCGCLGMTICAKEGVRPAMWLDRKALEATGMTFLE